jgi:hypothetical protein
MVGEGACIAVMSTGLECDFPGDVNVKQMDFAIESHQLSYGRLAASAK